MHIIFEWLPVGYNNKRWTRHLSLFFLPYRYHQTMWTQYRGYDRPGRRVPPFWPRVAGWTGQLNRRPHGRVPMRCRCRWGVGRLDWNFAPAGSSRPKNPSKIHDTIHFHRNYCIIPSCWVTFWTHSETIPVGQFFWGWIKSINQA